MPDASKSPLVPLVVAVVAALVLALVLFQGGGETDEAGDPTAGSTSESPDPGHDSAAGSTSSAPPETWEQLVRRDADDPMVRGETDAPVVMVAYSEFQCPYCGKFARDTEPVLVDKYVEEGILRIEWRDFPYLGPESDLAAMGGRAAAEQDRFWEFAEAMYADQLPPNSGKLDKDHLAATAERAGLDVDRFLADLDSPELEQAVRRDSAEGQAIGVSGTPAFVINGVPVIGAQPVEVFEQTIEQAAEDAGS